MEVVEHAEQRVEDGDLVGEDLHKLQLCCELLEGEEGEDGDNRDKDFGREEREGDDEERKTTIGSLDL